MTLWARIEGDEVVELVDQDPAGRYHPSITWVQVPAAWETLIDQRCRYVNRRFRPPLAHDPATGAALRSDDLDWLKARAKASIRRIAAAARVTCAKTSDPLEVAGWPAKEALARRHASSTTDAADDAALLAEATQRGQTVAALVARIQAKAALYKPVIGEIDGWQSKAEKAVDDATSATRLVTDLATLKASAETALATLVARL